MRLIISITCIAVCGGSWLSFNFGVQGRHHKTAAVASNRCDTEDNCEEGMCCVTHSRDPSESGRCQRMGRNRKRCNSPEARLEYYGGKFALHCPCQEGLVCDTGGNKHGIRRCTAMRDEQPEAEEPEAEEEPESEESDESEEEPQPEELQENPKDDRCDYCKLHC